MSSTPLLEFQNVSKFYRNRENGIVTAVDDISFFLEKGKILGLVGQSGSGKTTVGRISVGLTIASKGHVYLEGVEVSKMKNKKQLWRRAQYIHQDPYSSLDPYMTSREILERPLKFLLNLRGEQLEDPIRKIMSVIDLPLVYLEKRVQELSGGERQRILLARAFIVNPVYAVADEPTTMIDFIHRNTILKLLLRLKSEYNTSFLLITHDLSVAADLCDDIAIMKNGKIVESGKKDQVLNNPREQYTRELLSATPENLVSVP